jgi:hypothetical protein
VSQHRVEANEPGVFVDRPQEAIMDFEKALAVKPDFQMRSTILRTLGRLWGFDGAFVQCIAE